MTRNADVASTPAPAAASPSGMGPYGAVACAMGGPCFVAVYLGLCLVLFVLVAVLTWTEGLTACLTCPQDTLRLYAYISCAGGLGAVIYCIRGFYKHYSLGDYDRRYAFWYLFRPWIGAVLGMVSYLLIVGGLLAFENGLVAGQNLRTKALFVAVAFLSGFSANEFIMKVNAVAKALFGTETQNAPP
ncbi:MAG TPA: hypothetical protein PK280_16725, partial [Planctomycetota bacterium]|nr:hypothetical protein [Planctomycetota bacterium]